MSYLKTRIRGSRLQNAARLLALIELSRRLHQAYRHAYDKQAADQLLPQEPKYRAVVKSDIIIADTSQTFDTVLDEIIDAILDISNNQICSDAFKKYGLQIPYDSVLSSKFRIAPSATLFRPNAARVLGLTSKQVEHAQRQFSTSMPYTEAGGAGYTARNGNNLTMIFNARQLRNPIFGGLKAVAIHEFIHAGGKEGRDPRGAPYGDLNYFKEGYEEIQKACQ